MRDNRGKTENLRHIVTVYFADIAQPEARTFRELARINDISAGLEHRIHVLEIETGLIRIKESRDEGPLPICCHVGFKAQFGHAFTQRLIDRSIAGMPSSNAAFGFELPERLGKCRHDMRGRSEPPFAVILLERFILRSQNRARANAHCL